MSDHNFGYDPTAVYQSVLLFQEQVQHRNREKTEITLKNWTQEVYIMCNIV